MDQVALVVVRAVESGATTTKGIIGVTGLSRLKVERALGALEKQKLLFRESQGSWALGFPVAPPVRQCGSCTACCKVLEVTDLGKPVNTVCNHILSGGGCDIYDRRPRQCRSFSCGWLQGHLDDDWFPATAGMVAHFGLDTLNVQVDIDAPDRWREEPYFSKLCELSLKGLRVSEGRPYATLVIVGDDRYLLLGRTIVPDPTLFGTAFVPITHDTFHYWKAKSLENLRRLNDRVMEIQRIQQEFGYCAIPEDDEPTPPYRPALLENSKQLRAARD
ncbi:YkgJ family cysteine cluster protein [Bradyrhizobium septentrionale]|uniref:YkgJ family cysteine cluster protein n=1 Tax=Bradyrhizobium septentrionale TaxID=1404411 RepID=A0A973W3F0_9BRAD|nr:YkgJ family cysteine cluster protein [Bradyrhizobium septentrionale]UGY15288.1 YkgJ family cysteine cluster protein [Bradyrhizobium septentrionale]UGY23878.1 YkgJ family cysteine cluster protein [Bradyrhizobium septentrionale]